VKVESSGESVFGNVKNAPAGSSPTTPDGITKAFRIKKAEWKFDKSELKVEGEGGFKALVEIFDVTTGARLGKVTVDAEGKWKFRQKNPASVPLRIRAESKGSWKERDVLNAPQSTSSRNNVFEKLVSAA
jgi:hypothetical protein